MTIIEKMTTLERRAVFALSGVTSLRMLGLFMVIPLIALYASQLPGATPLLIGLSIGVYGLTQAILQIPFGALSDHVGRKRIITLGLCIFILGSILCALSHTIEGLLFGRALQGAGAIGSTTMALMADLTRVSQRTKAMALAGITIGLSFTLAMILGPVIAAWTKVNGIFWIAAILGVIALVILHTLVPTPEKSTWHAEAEPELQQFPALLKHPQLARLNMGVFILHAMFTASFVAIPISLHTELDLASTQQWMLYLPTLIIGFFLSIPCMLIAEKKHYVKPFYLGAVLTLGVAEILLWQFASSLLLSVLSLLLFFGAFSLLEAFQPSLVSKTAPANRKGTALGIYSFSQFMGMFIGGALGGWLYGVFGLPSVYLFCAILAFSWLAIAFTMKNPQYSHHSSSTHSF